MILYFDIVTYSAQIALIIPRKQDNDFMSAYHFYGNFGENFLTNGTGSFCFAPKTGKGLSLAIYKIPVKFSLSLQRKLGIGCPHKLSFLSKRGKGNTSQVPFF